MEKCPKCGSVNTRKSTRQAAQGLIKARFRCRDCGARFNSVDFLRIEIMAIGLLALLTIAGVTTWAVYNLPGNEPFAELTKDGQSPALLTSRPSGPIAITGLELDIAQQKRASDPDTEAEQYLAALTILQRSWKSGDPARSDNREQLMEAIIEIGRAANQGHFLAQLILAYLYDSGHGVTKSYEKALQWYRRAAVTALSGFSQGGEAIADPAPPQATVTNPPAPYPARP